MTLLFAAIILLATGALASGVLARVPAVASLIGSSFAVLGSLLGLVFALRSLVHGDEHLLVSFEWALPNASLTLGIDPLTSFFLVPLFLIAALAAVFGHGYWGSDGPLVRRGLAFGPFNLLVLSMAILLLARHAILFLVAWETMSLCAYLLVTYKHEELEVRRAGWVYLVAAHFGVLCLLALFLLLHRYTGSLEFYAIAQGAPFSMKVATGLFLLALGGFGVKAGLFPLHVWLPQAHAAAPSHVSALMSAVLIKMGLYGIIRVCLLLGGPREYWGAGLLCLGGCSALYGISLAVYQRDLKRVLAYSSVENMGIISLGLGLGFWGRSSGHPEVALLGVASALLHVYHHSLMKGLMFLLSGSVLHACGTKDLEKLGGLGKRMPVSFSLFTLGAVAISGLPPLNGFVSEWLLYSGLMRGAQIGREGGAVACVFAIAMLSLIGAIAALCFVRLLGTTMLGEPRSRAAAHAHESSATLLLPMAIMAGLIVTQALVPTRFLALIEPTIQQVLGDGNALRPRVEAIGLVELVRINSVLFVGLGLLVAIGMWVWGKGRVAARVPTWDCGFAAPTARMQYTARGMSELFTENLLPSQLRPPITKPKVAAVLPTATQMQSDSADPLTRDVYEPFFAKWAARFARLRVMQQGHLHIYLVYILVTLLVALGFSVFQSAGGAP